MSLIFTSEYLLFYTNEPDTFCIQHTAMQELLKLENKCQLLTCNMIPNITISCDLNMAAYLYTNNLMF